MTESQQAQEWMAEGSLRTSKTLLRGLLEDRLGTLPHAVVQRIDACTDPDSLQEAVRQVARFGRLDDRQV
jgi:hypothetical protein